MNDASGVVMRLVTIATINDDDLHLFKGFVIEVNMLMIKHKNYAMVLIEAQS